MNKLFTAVCYICLSCCNTAGAVQPNSGPIYSSTIILIFDLQSMSIEATRLSSFQPLKKIDTMVIRGTPGNRNAPNGPSTSDTTIYRLIAQKGEQIHFESADKVKFWLRESSEMELSFSMGKVSHVKIAGEACLETPHAILLSPNHHINLILTSTAKVNLQSNVKEKITIALIKGNLNVSPEYGKSVVQPTSLTEGNEITVDLRTNIYNVKKCDTTEIFSWKNAGVMDFTDANLRTIVLTLDNWYRTHTVFDSLPDDKYVGKLPYTLALDDAIKSFNAFTNMNFHRKGDTIFVTPRGTTMSTR